MSAVATIVVVAAFAVLTSAWLLGSGEPPVVIQPPVPTTGSVPTTTSVPETTVPTSDNTTVTTPAASALVVPSLGEGWDLVLSARPGDSLLLGGASLSITDAGYYVGTFGNDKYDRYLMRRDGNAGTLVDIDVPGSGGFVTGGPGVVAWANVGPESNTEAQLWVSSDGVNFERVANDLFAGCAGTSNCRGTEILAVAGEPSGQVVALAYDPLVWKPECDCFEGNTVALVSDDGREWTRQPLDLLSVLPAEWQGWADIRNSQLVYVEGRWLTYGTHYYNDGYSTDTAFFASENGIEWQPIDTGGFFDGTYLAGMAANDRGVVAMSPGSAYWSADGSEWTRSTLTDCCLGFGVAAYHDGYVAVSAAERPDHGYIDTIWYSADGTTWARMSLQLEEATGWNAIVGDGSDLVAIGGTETNLNGIWRWSG